MPEPYEHSGLHVATYRGRSQQLQRLLNNFRNKTTPDQVSVVGPRHFGKTVLLKRLHDELAATDPAHGVILWWDLKRETPKTDAEFFDGLARRLGDQLNARALLPEYGSYLQPGSEGLSDSLRVVVEELGSRQHRVVLFLDGFDHLAKEPQVSRNLWDYLRSAAQSGTLFYVIAGRRSLREAIADRDGRSSEFWNIFVSMEVIKPLEPADMVEWLEPLKRAEASLDEDATAALLSWTGGVALLMARLCSLLRQGNVPRQIARGDIDRMCLEAGTDVWMQEHLEELWDDCPEQTRGDLMDLASDEGVWRRLAQPRRKPLVERGYLTATGPGTFSRSCELMLRLAASQEIRRRDLRELVADDRTTLQTLKSILELRLAAEPEVPLLHGLRAFVQLAVHSLGQEPRVALAALRSVADEAVDVAWNAEFPSGQIPATVQQHLTLPRSQRGPALNPNILGNLADKNARRTILRAACGSLGSAKVTTKVSRPLMVLIDHVTGLGNYGQHIGDVPPQTESPPDAGFCIGACWASVELLRRAAVDLP
jgi:hypothetical protein